MILHLGHLQFIVYFSFHVYTVHGSNHTFICSISDNQGHFKQMLKVADQVGKITMQETVFLLAHGNIFIKCLNRLRY